MYLHVGLSVKCCTTNQDATTIGLFTCETSHPPRLPMPTEEIGMISIIYAQTRTYLIVCQIVVQMSLSVAIHKHFFSKSACCSYIYVYIHKDSIGNVKIHIYEQAAALHDTATTLHPQARPGFVVGQKI